MNDMQSHHLTNSLNSIFWIGNNMRIKTSSATENSFVDSMVYVHGSFEYGDIMELVQIITTEFLVKNCSMFYCVFKYFLDARS